MAEGTITLPGLLAALGQSEEETTLMAARARRMAEIALLILCLLVVASIVWALYWLRDAWHTGQWKYFWDTPRDVWPLLAFGTKIPSLGDLPTRYLGAARSLREAAIKGDDQLAPLAQENSLLTPDSSALFGGVRCGPLKRPRDGRTAGPIVLLFMSSFIVAPLGLVLLLMPEAELGTLAEEIIGGSIAILILLDVWALIALLRMKRGIIVTADDAGITWKLAGWRTRRKSLAWHEAQALFVIRQRRSTNWVKETTWVLMGSSGALAWTVGPEAAAQADFPHARFAALVAARTRLPLRDLSALVNRLSNTEASIAEQCKAAIEDATRIYEETKREILAARAQPEQAKAWLSAQKSEQVATQAGKQATTSSGLGWGCTTQLVLTVVIILVYAAGWGLQQYQPHYFAGVLAQIHASRPLYHDALSDDNGEWDVTLPTEKDHTLVFKDGAYHVAGTRGNIVYVWHAFEYRDSAVEVTARQIGTAGEDGVGLVLRVNADGSDMVTFYVDTTGSWWLWHYRSKDGNPDHEWTELYDGHSGAIRTGAGAENRLLVLMRGGQYMCYVNGQFVERYDDDAHATPRSGHMGVYLNDGATEGAFTNFTVYPAPPPSLWSAL